MPARDVAALYFRWTCARAALARGWWLVTSLYLVVDAGLSPFELVFIGTAQAATGLVFEIPAGVLADTISRKTSIVVAHLLMGAGMAITGLVTEFPALVATQMLWGFAWTFSSGADVAWLTDEMRAEYAGEIALGLGIGVLAQASGIGVAMAGAAVLVGGAAVIVSRSRDARLTPS